MERRSLLTHPGNIATVSGPPTTTSFSITPQQPSGKKSSMAPRTRTRQVAIEMTITSQMFLLRILTTTSTLLLEDSISLANAMLIHLMPQMKMEIWLRVDLPDSILYSTSTTTLLTRRSRPGSGFTGPQTN